MLSQLALWAKGHTVHGWELGASVWDTGRRRRGPFLDPRNLHEMVCVDTLRERSLQAGS